MIVDLILLAVLFGSAFYYARRGFAAGIVQMVGSFVSLVAMLLRYFCSFLSGWILWAALCDATYMQEVIGTYIPALANVSGTTLAIVYSLVYNGVYMIPEIILTCVVGFLLVQFAGNQILDKKDQ